ncbi:unnamed protein product [Ilex paraguariensis]|uniref:Uncharacterized protein n=1 Tax=Ilex paraguariensis TaxID=185542 RepID=A0ABC8UHS7_9AQUA
MELRSIFPNLRRKSGDQGISSRGWNLNGQHSTDHALFPHNYQEHSTDHLVNTGKERAKVSLLFTWEDCLINAEETTPFNKYQNNGLKNRLLRLIFPRRSETIVLQNWVNEGRKFSISELQNIAKQLMKRRHYKHTFEDFCLQIYVPSTTVLIDQVLLDCRLEQNHMCLWAGLGWAYISAVIPINLNSWLASTHSRKKLPTASSSSEEDYPPIQSI